ncbi:MULTISPECIES: microcin C ABC transporter permease YejB [Paracoccus]|jgi:microcin C transport system permease protein|uniref:Microcin C ABC transporter permease YejB n=3 Tax=root TaxID=1 RepID=A0A5C4R4H3_9RHOB|nr:MULTISPECIES: microcin C ABC transporter permease YejB [Paracoccus]TYP69305.1 microcin C transport system permease protein [Stutzerimonas stutzeri]KIX18404.1 microcin ABC transporter permease [Paracoccus sp. 228]MBF5077728.1 microcin C ABC transporter permease YejB [Paracoccus sp. NBH48]QXI64603.1 Inner membrane ABC transporter permease protein YejB [Paracoccus marcusii]TNH38883.1 microcin C ABC transporter permease YejB [Paracoccus haeundaensis]|tara:strand:+ start:3502 stop:4584 length:1083 start_codon:yes stop_codon:yes gene_type:complete
MGAYILRRLLLIIPTLIGIMVVNFTLTQFVPGGPIEQIAAQVRGEGDVLGNLAGATADSAEQLGGDAGYEGARGLPPEFIAQLEKEFGFDKPPVERFFSMMWNYIRFDFGTSWFRSISVMDLVVEKMPVSITLGLWSTLIAYVISIPLGIRKAVRDGSRFDTWTSGVIIMAYAIPAFLFAVILMVLFAGGSYWQIFPLRGLTSDNFADLSVWGKVKDYAWHAALPVIAATISSFATLTLLTKNSFLDEINKQYVMTARAKGLTERRVLYGHVFRNAMLIVIAGFPAMFLGVFFGSSILIETIFSLDGLGRLGFEAAVQRDYPVIFGTLYVFGLMSLVVGILSDLMYVFVDPRIDFEKRAG